MNKVNIAVLASGNGTNFQALAKAVKNKNIRAKIKLLITDKKNAFARERAKKLNIKEIFINPKGYSSRRNFEKELIRILAGEKVNLILLAGYMRILSPFFVKKFKNRILNIHPSLLPSFKGANSIERAFNCGCKVTGVTVHFVNQEVDCGPIILQKAIEIKEGDSLKKLEEKVHKTEHVLYPKAVNFFLQGRLKISGRRVKIK